MSKEFLAARSEFKSKDDRLSFLYSAFPQRRNANPQGYSQAVDWWKNLLTDWVWDGCQPGKGEEEKHRIILNVNEGMKEALRWDGIGTPSALGDVIRNLARSHDLVPITVFNSTATFTALLPSHTRSASSLLLSTLITGPLSWVFSQLNPFTSDEDPYTYDDDSVLKQCKASYVIVSNLDKASKLIMKEMEDLAHLNIVERLFTTEGWKKKFNTLEDGTRLSNLDLDVLLKYFQRDYKVLVVDRGVVKILSSIATTSTSSDFITSEDRGILELKQSSTNLTRQITDIEERITQQTKKIDRYLKSKQKSMALSYLRSKKQLEALVLKRTGTLETITSILLAIETASGDVEIMRTYELGTKTLRSLLADPSLSPERIDDTMETLSETLTDQKEIDDAIQMGGDIARRAGGEIDVDEEELQSELKMLEEEMRVETLQGQQEKEMKDSDRAEEELRRVEEGKSKLTELEEKESKRVVFGEKEEPKKVAAAILEHV